MATQRCGLSGRIGDEADRHLRQLDRRGVAVVGPLLSVIEEPLAQAPSWYGPVPTGCVTLVAAPLARDTPSRDYLRNIDPDDIETKQREAENLK
ncbi:hypothetical protein ACVILJ_007930 [Bradyrhizobium diazoefficiens]